MKFFQGETTVILFIWDSNSKKFPNTLVLNHPVHLENFQILKKKFPDPRTACLLSSFHGAHGSPALLIIPQMNVSVKPGLKETHYKVRESVNFPIPGKFPPMA
jgi:hypothetical protein